MNSSHGSRVPRSSRLPVEQVPVSTAQWRAATVGRRARAVRDRRWWLGGRISRGRRPRDRVRAGCTCFDQTGGFCHCECPSAYVRGEAQQTQLAMSLVLHRIPGIGSPRDFIRFLRCQYLHLPVRSSGFERLFAHGLARTAIERPNSLELPPP